jgi:MHS family citrate/tricarballylate:H+ symporter-like MFS transporter
MTTYAIATLHMPANVAFAATVVVGLTGVTVALVGGALSDRIGRKPMMLVPGILLVVSILPAFYIIAHYRTTVTLLGATAVLSSLAELSTSPIVVWLTESLPAAIRSGGVAIIYAISIAAFGGTTQYSVTWIIKATRNPLAPAWYWTVAAIIGVTAMIATRESAPRKAAKPETVMVPLPDASDSISS